MNVKYRRIGAYLGVLLFSASDAQAQFQSHAPVFELPAGVEEILASEMGPPLVVAEEPLQNTPIFVPDEESYSLVSVEAPMILLAQTETDTKVYVPKHIAPHVFVRLFGGTNIPTRLFVAPFPEQR